MTIQSKILDYINERGIKQVTIAEKCGWNKVRLHNMLHEKQCMSIEDYGLICNALGVPYDFFYQKSKSA